MFTGGGEAGRLMAALDWSATPLGPVNAWPQSLRTAVSICLASRFPIVIYWGPEYVTLYNDAYSQILAAKHPWALGRSARDVWAEIWNVIGPMLEGVVSTAEATWSDDLLLMLERRGYPEECYFCFSFSPVRVEGGGVGGVFTVVTETTGRVLNERRQSALRELAARASEAKTADAACANAAASLALHEADVPFALLYLLDESGIRASLAGVAWLQPGSPAAPRTLAIAGASPPSWPVAEAMKNGRAVLVEDVGARFGSLPAGPWSESAHAALVLPIAPPAQKLAGFLIVGVSPRCRLDDAYRSFFELAAVHVSAAVANARAHEEERRRAEALAELDRTKTAFFSNVSHEFRTPLTLMLGPLEELLKRAGELPAANVQMVEMAHRNGLRLLKLVNSLLDFARLEAGKALALFEPTALGSWTAEIAACFHSAIEKAGLRLETDCPELEEAVYVDRQMWEKLVLNLLSNAFKFTFEGAIRVSLRRAGDTVELAVSDTGTGIPDSELPHLFTRFHRIQSARGRSHEGTGIGLALVQEIVEQHGGAIRVESVYGAGTTFTVAIPLGRAHLPKERIGAPRTADPVAAPAFVEEALRWLPSPASPLVSTPQRAEARVFIAEDNADMRNYLTRLLHGHYEVEMFADGAEALEAVRANPPDLLLADVMMPRMDGFELLAGIRADEKLAQVRVILLSARAGEESKVEGLGAGADDYLVKPFTTAELLARVRAHVQMGRSRQAAERSVREAQKLESIGVLAGGIAHDFNNLLVGVLGNACLILENLSHDHPNHSLAEEIVRAAEAAAGLTRQLLAYAGKGQVIREPLNLRKLVRHMAPLLRLGMPKEVELQLELNEALPTVEADASQMQQLFMNLVINAAEAIGDRRRGIVRVSLAPRPGEVEIAVADNGCGMAEEVSHRIFDPFFSTKFTGRGLGLAAVQGIVRAHRGTIRVETAPGRGTTFRVTLPAAALAREEPNVAATAGGPPAEGTILVVDDEEMVQSAARRMLERLGYQVLLAESGLAAIELYRRNRERISLVLLDWAMPGMNGEDTLRALQKIAPAVRVVICTGHAHADAAARFGETAAAFLQKPFTVQELADKVKTALAPSVARMP